MQFSPDMALPFKSYNQLQNLSSSPAIMESIDMPPILARSEDSSNKLLPDVTLTTEYVSLQLGSVINEDSGKSFLLIDSKEVLQVTTESEFLSRLGCEEDAKVKVVSIFGNTGDGKSHTLNHTFFNEEPVFKTSNEQDSCTLGVWAAYDRSSNVIVLDTEGLLGASPRENQRVRMLLKVLAVSDVIIYRTRAERLHTDMYSFLASASLAYTRHFQKSLASLSNKADFCGPLSTFGPTVLIFHETRNTSPLSKSGIETPEEILRTNFVKMKLNIEAFSSLFYVGIQTLEPPTNFNSFRKKLDSILTNTSVRSPRSPVHVFHTLKLLNDKFSDSLKEKIELFADEYFSCQVVCLSCGCRCSASMGHAPPHSSTSKCRYQQQFENVTYLCKKCHNEGREVIVEPKMDSSNDDSWLSYNRYASYAWYAWSGYSIDCPHCGEIYRSRQYWYGNQSLEQSHKVRQDLHHVWPGVKSDKQTALNSAQKVVDKVSGITDAISSVTAQPTKMIAQWAADQIAPKYWKPNDEIKVCIVCADTFGNEASKHHCRSCGEGVCKKCSSRKRPVPERGWTYPVRVCDHCFTPRSQDGEVTEVNARKLGEAMVTTISSVASFLEYPKSVIKASVRPGYWVPDEDARECCVCNDKFTAGGEATSVSVHHCRDCGGTVCSKCSRGRAPVPHRGWPDPVRVCDKCLPTS